ncbi:MAG: hypothetical protein AAF646_16705 [Pseudomonadota bacterium]
MQVVFTINGPGEVSGWLHPLTVALKARLPGVRIVVCVLPCVFSSGAERDVIGKLATVDAVASVAESLKLIATGRGPDGFLEEGVPTLVFHLGGEPILSVALGWRLAAERYAYVERRSLVNRLFGEVFFNGLAWRPGDRPGGTVGELMVDAARLRRAEAEAEAMGAERDGRPCVALFPGSRTYMAIHLLPYYAVTVDAIAAERPDIDWVLARADYISMETLRHLPPPPEGRTWPAVPLSFREEGGVTWMETDGGTRIRILSGAEAIARADIALTIPGTNTGELAASGVPMVVVLPTYLGHEVPLPGIPGHLGRLPLLGRLLKISFGWWRVRKLGLLAQPNVRSGRMLVPEFVGEGLHASMQDALEALMDQDTTALSDELRATMGAPGAAYALASRIAAFFTDDHRDAVVAVQEDGV